MFNCCRATVRPPPHAWRPRQASSIGAAIAHPRTNSMCCMACSRRATGWSWWGTGSMTDRCWLARKTLRVVRQTLWWAAGYNALSVPLAIAGYMPAWLAGLGMALSSLLVVLNAARLSFGLQALAETGLQGTADLPLTQAAPRAV